MIKATRTYRVEILEHPKEGAQEHLGNGNMFEVLLASVVRHAGVWGILHEYESQWDLYNNAYDVHGPYWDRNDYNGPAIKHLYGPVKVRVTHLGDKLDI